MSEIGLVLRLLRVYKLIIKPFIVLNTIKSYRAHLSLLVAL